jgi:hypothetical protein
MAACVALGCQEVLGCQVQVVGELLRCPLAAAAAAGQPGGAAGPPVFQAPVDPGKWVGPGPGPGPGVSAVVEEVPAAFAPAVAAGGGGGAVVVPSLLIPQMGSEGAGRAGCEGWCLGAGGSGVNVLLVEVRAVQGGRRVSPAALPADAGWPLPSVGSPGVQDGGHLSEYEVVAQCTSHGVQQPRYSAEDATWQTARMLRCIGRPVVMVVSLYC